MKPKLGEIFPEEVSCLSILFEKNQAAEEAGDGITERVVRARGKKATAFFFWGTTAGRSPSQDGRFSSISLFELPG